MRKYVCLVVVVAVFSLLNPILADDNNSIAAQPTAQQSASVNDDVQWTYGLKWVERYHIDAGEDFYSAGMVQNFIGASVGAHYLEYWRGDGNTTAKDTFAREDDLTYGLTQQLTPRVSLTAGVLYVKVNDNSFGLNAVVQPRVLFTVNAGEWSIVGNVKRSFTNAGYIHSGGWFIETGAARDIKLWKALAFTTDTLATYDVNGAFGFDPALTLREIVGVKCTFANGFAVFGQRFYAKNFGETVGREDHYASTRFGMIYNF